jgi:molybdenum-dependent DNA-binding transcriptional regulator ModE
VLPTAEAALGHGGKGDALVQRERGRGKGYGAFLTTLGSCDDD